MKIITAAKINGAASAAQSEISAAAYQQRQRHENISVTWRNQQRQASIMKRKAPQSVAAWKKLGVKLENKWRRGISA